MKGCDHSPHLSSNLRMTARSSSRVGTPPPATSDSFPDPDPDLDPGPDPDPKLDVLLQLLVSFETTLCFSPRGILSMDGRDSQIQLCSRANLPSAGHVAKMTVFLPHEYLQAPSDSRSEVPPTLRDFSMHRLHTRPLREHPLYVSCLP